MSAGPDGILVIDKPAGMTSHDVVDAIRKRFRTKKVGHAGTLDPDATGLLIVGLGKATRLLAYAQGAPKRYSATARFGISTSTQDASGEVVSERACSFTADDLVRMLERFTGSIEQVPPMVSAVKIGGQRLHELARRGMEVERPARPVTVHALALTAFREGENPEADLDVHCSSGTYIRTLIHDVGEALGCGAHMTSLRRTATAGFEPPDSKPLDEVSESDIRPLSEALRSVAQIQLEDGHAMDVQHGRRLPGDLAPGLGEQDVVGLLHGGELVAVYRRAGDQLVADRVVPS